MDQIHEQARILIATIKMLRQRFFSERAGAGRSNQLDKGQFTEAQIGTMIALRDEGELSLKQLAEVLNVSSPSASAMVDRLVEAGIVDRRPCVTDRREVRIDLTDSGRAAVEEYEQAWLASASDLLEKIGPEWAEQWCAVYRRVQEVLEAERAGSLAPAQLEGERGP